MSPPTSALFYTQDRGSARGVRRRATQTPGGSKGPGIPASLTLIQNGLSHRAESLDHTPQKISPTLTSHSARPSNFRLPENCFQGVPPTLVDPPPAAAESISPNLAAFKATRNERGRDVAHHGGGFHPGGTGGSLSRRGRLHAGCVICSDAAQHCDVTCCMTFRRRLWTFTQNAMQPHTVRPPPHPQTQPHC